MWKLFNPLKPFDALFGWSYTARSCPDDVQVMRGDMVFTNPGEFGLDADAAAIIADAGNWPRRYRRARADALHGEQYDLIPDISRAVITSWHNGERGWKK